MGRRAGVVSFAELLPDSIAGDSGVKAAADALNEALNQSIRAIPDLLIFARLAGDSGFINPVPLLPPMARLAALNDGLKEIPEPLLDLLAWQLHVDAYESAVDIQAKRGMIQNSLMLHRRKGTPWAVRHALETALRVEAQIPQWFEYGGKPYFFRVRLDVTGVEIDIDWIMAALRLIFAYKNVRSWLEYLQTFSTNPLPVYVAMASVSRTLEKSRLWQKPVQIPKTRAFYAFGAQTTTRSILCPKK